MLSTRPSFIPSLTFPTTNIRHLILPNKPTPLRDLYRDPPHRARLTRRRAAVDAVLEVPRALPGRVHRDEPRDDRVRRLDLREDVGRAVDVAVADVFGEPACPSQGGFNCPARAVRCRRTSRRRAGLLDRRTIELDRRLSRPYCFIPLIRLIRSMAPQRKRRGYLKVFLSRRSTGVTSWSLTSPFIV